MRKLLLAAVASLSLAGCTTIDLTAADAFVQTNLPAICNGADAAYAAFALASTVRPVSQRTADRVATARAVLRPLCADPSRARTGDVIVAAFTAYATIKSARDEARG